MAFDVAGAVQSGASISEINEYLAQKRKFNLAGARESGASELEILNHLNPPTPPQQGFWSAFKGSAGTLGDIPESFGMATAKNPEEAAAARAAMLAGQDTGEAQTSFDDVLHGEGKVKDWLAQTAGGSMGALAAPAAAAGATLLTPAAPLAPVVGAATLFGQYGVTGLQRQAQEQQQAVEAGQTPQETSVGKSAVAAGLSTGLDVLGMKFFAPVFKAFPIVGRMFGTEGAAASETAAKQAAEAFKKGQFKFTSGMLKGTAEGAAFEVPQEIGQQMLERWQAGLPLNDDDAKKEYIESAAGAIALGGPLGALKGAAEVGKKRTLAKDEIARQEAVAAQEAQPEPTPETPPTVPPAPTLNSLDVELFNLSQQKQTKEVKARIKEIREQKQALWNQENGPNAALREDQARRDEGKSPETELPEDRRVPIGTQGELRPFMERNMGPMEPTPEAPVEEAPKPFATVLTPEKLIATGLKPQSGFFKNLVGKDLANPQHVEEVRQLVRKIQASDKLAGSTKAGIAKLINQEYETLATQAEIDFSEAAPQTAPEPTQTTPEAAPVVPEPKVRKRRAAKAEEPVEGPPPYVEPDPAIVAERKAAEKAKAAAREAAAQQGEQVVPETPEAVQAEPTQAEAPTAITPAEQKPAAGFASQLGVPEEKQTQARAAAQEAPLKEAGVEQRKPQTELERFGETIKKSSDLTKFFPKKKRFSKAPAALTDNTADAVHGALSKAFDSVQNLNRLLRVFPTEEALLEAHPEVAEHPDYTPGFKGAVVGRKVLLVANRIERGQELAVFLHEAGAHLGFDQILTDKDRTWLHDRVRIWANQEGKLGDAARSALKQGGESSDEVIAYMVENLVNAGVKPTENTAGGIWLRRVYAKMKGALRKMGFLRSDFSPQDLVNMAFGAAHLEVAGTWHGTAADFRKFNHAYMGTGEGAQVRGWGSYLAQRRGIGKTYWKEDVERKSPASPELTTFETLSAGPEGNLMRVVPNVREEELLDLDKPLSEQSEYVRQTVEKIKAALGPEAIDEFEGELNSSLDDISGNELIKRVLPKALGDDYITGPAEVDAALAQGDVDKATSLYLDSIGIKGNKFLDQPSRNIKKATTLTLNGVTYTDADLKELRKSKEPLAKFAPLMRAVLRHGLDAERAQFANKVQNLAEQFFEIYKESHAKYNRNGVLGSFNEDKARTKARAGAMDSYEGQMLSWLDANASNIRTNSAIPTHNLVIFNDKNLLRVASHPGAKMEPENIRFSKANLQALDQMADNLPRAGQELYTDVRRNLSRAPDVVKKYAQQFLSLQQKIDLYGAVLPSLKTLNKTMELRGGDTMARREQLREKILEGQKIAKQYKRPVLERFYKQALETTRLQVDVLDKANKDHELYKWFQSLPKDLQKLYRDIRNFNDAAANEYIDLVTSVLSDTPDNTGVSPAKRMRAKFEDSRLKVYFALDREGEYWIEYTDKAGNRQVQSRKSKFEVDKLQREAEAAGGKDFRQFARIEQARYDRSAPPTGFMGDLGAMMTKEGVKPEVIDHAYQMYLSLFPAESIRQQFKHREGVLGYKEDLLETMAKMGSKMAHQLANLKYAKDIEAAMTAIEAEAAQNPTKEVADVVADLHADSAFIRNPMHSGWAQRASYYTYAYYILGNVSSAIVNLTNLPIMGWSLLGGEHGPIVAAQAMSDAAAMYLKGGINELGDWTAATGAKGEIATLLKTAKERAAIGRSVGYELMDMARTSTADYTGKWNKANVILGWVFQNSEQANREISIIAAYNLAKKRGMSPEAATEYALAMSTRINSSAMSETGPRIFQQGLGKVLFTFKKFAQQQLWIQLRLLQQIVGKADRDTKLIAARQLLGIYATTFAFAGASGLPVMGAAGMIAPILNAMFGDDDEPFDLEDQRAALLGDLLNKGVVNHYLNIDLSARVGMSNLLWREDKKRLAEVGAFAYAMEQLAGAPYSLGLNITEAMDLFHQGQTDKALEKLSPSVIRNMLKASRFATEGALNSAGVPIVDDISTYNVAMQFLGFNDAKLADAYEKGSARKSAETFIKDRQKGLLRMMYLARMTGDTDGMAETQDLIYEFNNKHPEKAITRKMLQQSYAGHMKSNKEMEDGVHIDKKLRPEIDAMYPGEEED